MGKWASTGRSRVTHEQRVAANTRGGAVVADRSVKEGGRGPNIVVSDRPSNVSEKIAIMWAVYGRSLATHNQDRRAANK